MKNTLQKPQTRRYITGFDGIRSLAVIGVIFYHIMPGKMQGGYLGVPLLFVLSGYLLTDHMRLEWQRNHKINIKQFYVRRLKRLYPSLVVLLIASSAYITLFQRNLLNNLRGIVVSSLLYVNNWWQINQGLSYFDRFGNESPFTHLWSLSVEGQNYLIWPLMFGLLMYFCKKKNQLAKILFGLACVSALLMGIMYTPGADPTRVYYGTDTRIFALWIGSALAMIWPSNQLRQQIPKQARNILNAVGLVSLALLTWAFFALDARYTFVYYGGMFLLTLLAALLVAVTAHPGASLNKWLTNPVFAYLGKRSYAIYLYQFPILIFYESAVGSIADHVWLHTTIEIILILVASELSYRFVETPLRKFDYSQTWPKIKQWCQKPWFNKEQPFVIPCALVTLVALVGIVTAPANALDEERQAFKEEIEKNQKLVEDNKKEAPNETTTSTEPSNVLNEELMAKYNLTADEYRQAQKLKVSAIGDSVMLGAIENIQAVFPQSVVDAAVGRYQSDAVVVANDLASKNLLYDTVVIGLANNGPITTAEFEQLMHTLGDRKVFIINAHVPTQRWQNENNQVLAAVTEMYSNVKLIDWYGASLEHPDWFITDQVHPTLDGRVEYVKLISQAIL